MVKTATVISYCTNDFRFLDKCIQEAKIFSDEIVIPVCDHFFDGTPENIPLLESTYARHPDCRFIEFAYLPTRLYSRYHDIGPEHPDWACYWAATSRYIGLNYLSPSIDYVLFLDSDEIVEGKAFLSWISSGKYLDAQRLAAYFYGLLPTIRSKKVVNLPLFVKKETLAPLTLLNPLERIGAYLAHPGPKKERVVGADGLPFVHHYSWTRTKEECLWKTRTWSHRNDANWPTLIDEAFSSTDGRLFGNHTEFETIPHAYFDPLASENVIKINDRDLFKKEIEHALL